MESTGAYVDEFFAWPCVFANHPHTLVDYHLEMGDHNFALQKGKYHSEHATGNVEHARLFSKTFVHGTAKMK